MSRHRTWIAPIFPAQPQSPAPSPLRDYILALVQALEKRAEGGQLDDALADKIERLLGVGQPLSVQDIHDRIRDAGGIVHGDGNIFFTRAEQFIVAAVLCGERPSAISVEGRK